MLGVLRFSKQCKVCRKRYKSKHTCYGTSHRPKTCDRQTLVCLSRPKHGSNDETGPSHPLQYAAGLNDHISCLDRTISQRQARPRVGLQAEPFPRSWGSERVLAPAQELRVDHKHLKIQAKITYHESIKLRLRGDLGGSQRAIQTFLSNLYTLSRGALCEDLMALHLSQAVNYAYQFQFSEAHDEVKKCVLMRCVTNQQADLLWTQVFSVGRIMRGEGRFGEAAICFKTCLESPGLNAARRYLVKSTFADLCCELAHLESQSSYLPLAKALVKPEIRSLRQSSGRELKGYRRLLLSVIETDIRQGQYDDANIAVQELLTIYSKLQEPDMVDRLGHVRTVIAAARIASVAAPLKVTSQIWESALQCNKQYNPFERDVFTCGVIYLFLYVTWHKLGNTDSSMTYLRKATQVFQRRKRQYLIPGMGTYLFRHICNEAYLVIGYYIEIAC
ncbi:hypothetical protein F4808DRAFT_51475 [Astrocystis sublimbata]|nr:hypothetical protein F4808DRAFT_51475 [Astrocystis sublimbata]